METMVTESQKKLLQVWHYYLCIYHNTEDTIIISIPNVNNTEKQIILVDSQPWKQWSQNQWRNCYRFDTITYVFITIQKNYSQLYPKYE